jgi:hypothetical protein
MVISLAIFFLLGIYLDNVLPSAYGLRKHWCYCLSPSYWCRKGSPSLKRKKSPKNVVDFERGGLTNVNEEDETFFEAKYMKRENFEPVSREL